MSTPAITSSQKLQIRPYQQRIVGRVVELFTKQGMRSILIDSPTGSGKTVMGLLIARQMQEQLGVRVGWVAMRRFLLEQAEDENRDKGINVKAEYISMFDREPPTGLDLLVVDEAQHDAASSMAHLHQRVRPRYILGLSATPFRSDRVKLCFDAVIKDAGIQTLIQDGYLSPYHHYTIPEHKPETVVVQYVRDVQRWGKSIAYFHTIEQCEEARRLFERLGIRVDVVTGSSDRDAQLEAFRAGKTQVLLNCMVLSEGFDCPELQTVFCRPSCKGVTIQMAGRVLRKHPEFPFKQIVQCSRTPWPFQRTASAAQEYVWQDEGWKSLRANPLIGEVNGRTLRMLAKVKVEMPRFLTRQNHLNRPQRRRWHTGPEAN
jgi:superfamily II DNA or RNA helicase